MGTEVARINFNDGEVLYAPYCNTTDYLCSNLYKTRDEAYEDGRADPRNKCTCAEKGELAKALVLNYNNEDFVTKACRKHSVITDFRDKNAYREYLDEIEYQENGMPNGYY
jgi:hypothetical protein